MSAIGRCRSAASEFRDCSVTALAAGNERLCLRKAREQHLCRESAASYAAARVKVTALCEGNQALSNRTKTFGLIGSGDVR
jgi:1,2-phenylacetyl-CoA epoxidase PaaB subunit